MLVAQLQANRLTLNSRNSSKPPSSAVQYGNGVKAQAVYLSQYQLIPYQRVQDYFQEQVGLPIRTDSVFNFNQQAFELLAQFEQKLISRLLASPLLHADETGINVDGMKQWPHCVSNVDEKLVNFSCNLR